MFTELYKPITSKWILKKIFDKINFINLWINTKTNFKIYDLAVIQQFQSPKKHIVDSFQLNQRKSKT